MILIIIKDVSVNDEKIIWIKIHTKKRKLRRIYVDTYFFTLFYVLIFI